MSIVLEDNKFGNSDDNGGGSSSFPMIVTDSGSSLPVDLTGYQVEDTFLNTSDKKIYKAEEGITGYELNSAYTVGTATVDLTTGVVSNLGGSSYNGGYISKNSVLQWKDDVEIKIHFKLNSAPTDNTGYFIFTSYNGYSGSPYTQRGFAIYVLNKKLYFCTIYSDTSPKYPITTVDLFDFELDTNAEYYLTITKNGTNMSADLSTSGYDGTKVATHTSTTTDYYTENTTVSMVAYGWGGVTFSNNYQKGFSIGEVYLADSSGEFVVANTSWDSGTSLTDKTEYADKTNGALYLYENSELVKIGSSAPTVLTDQASTSMALAGNTIYKWTSALTSLSFASVEVSDLETVLYFTTGGTISFTDSSSLKWGGDGSAPSLEINTIYCISIRNGLAEIDTFGTTA